MTTILPASATSVAQAGALLQQGEIVVIPTETVYGLGADATNPDAINKIFAAKKRPGDNPLIVHVGHKNDIEQYADIRLKTEKKLIEEYMPGPFTLILPKKDTICSEASAGLDTVGIRIPDHITALQCIRASGTAIAAPSANISGKPSPTSSSMALRDLKDKVPLIVDGGPCMIGIESTVVKVIDEKNVVILRPGMISKEDIEHTLGKNVTVDYSEQYKEQSPGTRYTHYSPNGKVRIVASLDKKMIQDYLDEGHNIGLIATKEFLSEYKNTINSFINDTQNENEDKESTIRLQPITTFPWGSHMKLRECAQSLYNLYHKCDDLHMSFILIEQLPEKGLGVAIMNKVKKSAENT